MIQQELFLEEIGKTKNLMKEIKQLQMIVVKHGSWSVMEKNQDIDLVFLLFQVLKEKD